VGDPEVSSEEILLWGSLERRFLIPVGTRVPRGYFPITSMMGEIALVDEDAVLPFEVTREEADMFLDRYVDRALSE
jgi:hypothetical protein